MGDGVGVGAEADSAVGTVGTCAGADFSAASGISTGTKVGTAGAADVAAGTRAVSACFGAGRVDWAGPGDTLRGITAGLGPCPVVPVPDPLAVAWAGAASTRFCVAMSC